MRRLIIMAMLLFTSRLAAQSPAADPNATDFSGKMDTIARNMIKLGDNLNAGLLNSDTFEDFFSGEVTSDTSPFRTLVRYGGPLIFDTTGYPIIEPDQGPELLADLTGDGQADVITEHGGGMQFLHRRITNFPYFDSLGTTQFTVHGKFPNVGVDGIADVNGDGVPDLICGANAENGFGPGIAIYYGSLHIGDSTFKYPDDSLSLASIDAYCYAMGAVSMSGKPMMFLGVQAKDPKTLITTYKIGVLRHLNDLAHDTVVWLSHTTNIAYNNSDSMIAPLSMYVTDITGDGIPDLLISDNAHIWIFAGSDSLGYYPLTKGRAYYSIPSPRLVDSHYDIMDKFGDYMHACGDLSGSGIPYLMVGGWGLEVPTSWAFFYAGGKALDSLYDAKVEIENEGAGFNMDTLHSIDQSGRSAVLLLDPEDYWSNTEDLNFLLYKDANKIPHTTNPRWLNAVSFPPPIALSMQAFPAIANHYTKFFIASSDAEEGKLTILNLLGQEITSRPVQIDPGNNTEYFDTSSLRTGTYFARIEANADDRSFQKVFQTRFIVQH